MIINIKYIKDIKLIGWKEIINNQQYYLQVISKIFGKPIYHNRETKIIY